MNMEKGKGWLLEILDEAEKFTDSIGPDTRAAAEILLGDDGQLNLVWDALKPLFPTCRIKSGDKLSAIEVGRLVGHWSSIWRFMVTSLSYLETLRERHRDLTEVNDKLAELLSHPSIEMDKSLEGSPLVLLETMTNPALVEAAIANNRQFGALLDGIISFVKLQPAHECNDFMKGYREALSSSPFDEKGLPSEPDKLALLLVFCRPAAIREEMTAISFQKGIDQLVGASVTGNPERFSKRLQRKRAGLRTKGRPIIETHQYLRKGLKEIGQILLPGVRFSSETPS
jgi:hypothetical protein